jgi:hypothetical protein
MEGEGMPQGMPGALATDATATVTELRSVSVVLPCLNEVESVALCVHEAREALTAAGLPHEVVVVDNGSTDGSAAAAEQAGARVVHEEEPGYGSALLTGFAAANGDVVVMADSDFTYDFGKLPLLVEPVLRGEADLVVGGRLDAATSGTMPLLHRVVGTPLLTFLVARACGRRLVRDSQSGYRAFRRDCLRSLGLRSRGMELASEMLIRAARAGLRVREVPTGYRARIGSSKLAAVRDGWRHLSLITLLAPDLLLIGPGLAALAIGIVFSVLAFTSRHGIEVGSLRWQPVFFSGIATILGVQATLAGGVLAHRSSLAAGAAQRRFSFIDSASFAGRCAVVGLALVLAGLLIDGVLFARWVRGSDAAPVDHLGYTSLAQSLIVVGSTLAVFGVIQRHLRSAPNVDDQAGAP